MAIDARNASEPTVEAMVSTLPLDAVPGTIAIKSLEELGASPKAIEEAFRYLHPSPEQMCRDIAAVGARPSCEATRAVVSDRISKALAEVFGDKVKEAYSGAYEIKYQLLVDVRRQEHRFLWRRRHTDIPVYRPLALVQIDAGAAHFDIMDPRFLAICKKPMETLKDELGWEFSYTYSYPEAHGAAE